MSEGDVVRAVLIEPGQNPTEVFLKIKMPLDLREVLRWDGDSNKIVSCSHHYRWVHYHFIDAEPTRERPPNVHFPFRGHPLVPVFVDYNTGWRTLNGPVLVAQSRHIPGDIDGTQEIISLNDDKVVAWIVQTFVLGGAYRI